MMNEFNEYVRDCFSEAGDIVIKPMMGGYLGTNGHYSKKLLIFRQKTIEIDF